METAMLIDPTAALWNEMSAETINDLLELTATAPIEIVRPPESGLSMLHALDAFDCEFLLGEVLVTRTEVLLDGQQSFAMVIGDEPERALARACVAALQQGQDELLKNRLQKLLDREQQRQTAERGREEQLIAATRVNFELLAGN